MKTRSGDSMFKKPFFLNKICLFSLITVFLFIYPPKNVSVNAENDKIAYLTFDDGPSLNTNKILTILGDNDIKATFFLVGNNIEIYPPAILLEILSRNHYIGLHSMTHIYKKLYTGKNASENFVNEMLEEQNLIYAMTGYKTSLVRPPFSGGNKLTDQHINSLLKYDFKVWDWNVDTKDWNCSSVSQVLKNIQFDLKLQHYPDRIVVLMHEKKISVKALPSVIMLLKRYGYRFEVYDPDNHFPINFRHYDYI